MVSRASVVVLLVGASLSAAHCQQSVQSLVDELTESRKNLPDFAGLYQEALTVTNSKPQEQAENVVSWGRSNSERKYIYAFGPSKSYSHMLPNDNSSIERAISRRTLCEQGRMLFSSMDHLQGGFSERRPGLVNPAGVGYEVRMGETLVNGIKLREKTHEPKVIGVDTVQFNDGQQSEVRFKRFGKQLIAESQKSNYQEWSNKAEVMEWMEYKDAYFPKKVRYETKRNGKPYRTIIYSLIDIEPVPAEYIKWDGNGWKEWALVADHDKNLVYTYRNGKLVLDPRFTASAERLKAKRTRVIAGLGIGGAAVTGLLIFFLRRRRTVKPKAA